MTGTTGNAGLVDGRLPIQKATGGHDITRSSTLVSHGRIQIIISAEGESHGCAQCEHVDCVYTDSLAYTILLGKRPTFLGPIERKRFVTTGRYETCGFYYSAMLLVY